jgi:hypothetical protein
MTSLQDRLKAVLDYNPKTGVWTRLVDGRWSKVVQRNAGYLSKQGYVIVLFNGKNRKASRLAWLYMTGSWPKRDLDHVNGNRSDDRWSNLRLATRVQNIANGRIRKDNTSGFKGVSFRKHDRKWVPQLRFRGKAKYLGCFDTPEKAYAAYLSAARKTFGEYFREA